MLTACSSPTSIDSSNPDSANATVASSSKPAADWQPQKPIDFVIMAGKGGGRRQDGSTNAKYRSGAQSCV